MTQSVPAPTLVRRRPVLGVLAILLLVFLYRVFAVYTVRGGECVAKRIDPSLRRLTRTEEGRVMSYPERTGYRQQQRPLVVMSYNIAGHDELYDGDHIRKVAATINAVKPDIVTINEMHRKTWQVRFRDPLAELTRATGMRGLFEPSYRQGEGGYGNAILTRGTFLSHTAYPLPTIGEPRSLLEAVVSLDGATINVFVTHLSAWGGLNKAIRSEQLSCIAQHLRGSRWPFIFAGDLNAPPTAEEMIEFRRTNVAQICGEDIGSTHPTVDKRLDYIFTDWGWEVRSARVLETGPSDHYPMLAELLWERTRVQ